MAESTDWPTPASLPQVSALTTKLVVLIEDVLGLTELNEFRFGLLDALGRAIPSDYASLNDLGSAPDDVVVVSIPSPAPDLLEAFARHRHENPIMNHHLRTGDGRAYRFSDLISRRELQRLALYREVYVPLGVEHQIAFTLPSDRGRLLAVALSRGRRDYTGGERDLLNRARPILIQAFRNAIEHDQLAHALQRLRDDRAIVEALIDSGLTAREAQIVNAIAHGGSPREIAGELGLSPRTVGKHLEHCFRKLGVRSQPALAARAWELGGR